MKTKKIYILAALVIPAFVITGCELAGLDLQQPYEYDKNAGMISNELNKTVLDFLYSRPDAFNLMTEGIEYAELTSMYNEPNSTYIALTNAAIRLYFGAHTIPNPNHVPGDPATGPAFIPPLSLSQYPKEQVTEFLLYHIVKGAYTWS